MHTQSEIPPSPAHPLQNLNEIGSLWEYVAARPHARVLEIGSLYGGTLWYWAHLPEIHTLVSVDLLPESGVALENAVEARMHWSEWFSPLVEFVDMPGSSRDVNIIRAACDYGPFDFAFIDGDHSYEGVRDDYWAWGNLIKLGGIVAFHDTWPNLDRHEPGVVRWVDELRHELPSVEWTDPDGVGICAFTLPT